MEKQPKNVTSALKSFTESAQDAVVAVEAFSAAVASAEPPPRPAKRVRAVQGQSRRRTPHRRAVRSLKHAGKGQPLKPYMRMVAVSDDEYAAYAQAWLDGKGAS